MISKTLRAVAFVAAVILPDLANALEVREHDLSVSIDPESRLISAQDRLIINGSGTATFTLADTFSPGILMVDGNPGVLRRDGENWSFDLGSEGSHKVIIGFRGTAHPMDQRSKGAVPRSGMAGSLLSAGTGWYPEFIDGGLFTYRVEVDVPAPHKVVGSGKLVEERELGSRYLATFEFDHPTDEISLFTGPWTITEKMHRGIRLRTYLDASVAGMADTYLDAVGRYLDLYSERLGPYPFSAFHIVAGPLPVGWGFPGLTYIGSRVLKLPYVLQRSLGHEILHNWLGNGVYTDYDQGNWAEGLTTYLADYLYAEQANGAAARAMRQGWLRDYAALPAERDMPLTDFRSKLHAASQVIGYNKSAFVFHMLRGEIGDAAFDAGLKKFWADNKFAIAGWDHLRDAFEATSDKDLTGFFTQWLTRSGAPSLRLIEAHAEPPRDGRYPLRITVAQEGGYALIAPLVVTTEKGIQRHRLTLGSEPETTVLTLDSKPESLAVDPDFDLFRRLDSSESPPILRDVTLDKQTRVVLLTEGEEGQRNALQLAWRMMEGSPKLMPSKGDGSTSTDPLMVIAIGRGQAAAYLQKAKLPPMPEKLTDKGTARVWVSRSDKGLPVMSIEADDATALASLLRPLPHYGRRSFLVFEGAKAVEKGIWPADKGPLFRDFTTADPVIDPAPPPTDAGATPEPPKSGATEGTH
ncbi:M1 family metallopeptidase [Magnetospira sp. QH-2]|uniref:M1 family metallopeptidase n=1 Tax=Magnetospira sp. (strain QH-2) TaxID=1288970 RepID=UPI0003E80ACB|nr:M1 family aminopeptidase [Magnetospira sp. QH-2]CCQ75170.1 putative Peptidase family M1 protein [Magnetospira sp. QH-2]